ncbi:TetR/AcrR family transcriptional regulator [Pedosphaera parvula]|uniref:Transcriptional regulator, TetR family n=1 Tax=Pedosphaera parvula (strain Ellin514) TaxID=320771 RepID=B9XMU4_PEDPL|nr:TetR/AcrR family transcriptional regulator [Pedosphaera parvula]EEF58869.1 transcriptional regulator, TetR family [Pedosphaera parvula Ellin514]
MSRCSDAKERLMGAVSELIWTGSYGSTTIDQICEKAGVKKGSFYYFFDSKSDLAIAALDANFKAKKAQLDSNFSPTVPPLERIRCLCDTCYQFQLEARQKYGSVLGCPLCTLGTEVSTQDEKLRAKIQEILEYHGKYVESAIRDAHAQGQIHAPDAAATARMIEAYYDGMLTQARIKNDVEILKEVPTGVFKLLGVTEQRPLVV